MLVPSALSFEAEWLTSNSKTHGVSLSWHVECQLGKTACAGKRFFSAFKTKLGKKFFVSMKMRHFYCMWKKALTQTEQRPHVILITNQPPIVAYLAALTYNSNFIFLPKLYFFIIYVQESVFLDRAAKTCISDH